jgi:hypothetical protein
LGANVNVFAPGVSKKLIPVVCAGPIEGVSVWREAPTFTFVE